MKLISIKIPKPLNTFQITLLVMLFIFCLNSFAQDPLKTHITTDLSINGKDVRVLDVNSYSVEKHQVRDKRGRVHTVKAYGGMWITFMASMIATELIFCSNQMLPWIANNEETPNCRDELSTMLQDPGMSLGVLAMTATSLELNRQGDNVLKRFARNLLKRHRGEPEARHRIHRAVDISRTVLQHLAMGAGMIVQTSISSTYNSPYMRECMVDIKNKIRKAKSATSDGQITDDAASAAVESAQDGENCAKARDYFFNSEDGTLSEIYITTISIGASSVIAAGVVSTLRFAGLAIMRFTPAGNAASTVGLILANPVIDIIDRYLEPIIRKAYHMNRSKRHLSYSFNELVESLDDYKSSQKLFTPYNKRTTCLESKRKTRAGHEVCTRWAEETVYSSKVLDDLKTHKYNIDYRRRANLNRFSEAQARWLQKVSSVFSNLAVFQSMIRNLYTARETLANDKTLANTNYLSVISKTKNPKEFFNHLSPPPKNSMFTKEQVTKMYALMNSFRKRITLNSYDQNRDIRVLIEALDKAIKQNNTQKAHVILWALKKSFSKTYLSRYDYKNYVLTGTPFTPEELSSMDQVITSMITSFTTISAAANFQFAANQIEFLESYEKDSSETSTSAESEPQATRKGVNLQQNDPLPSLLLVNKDDTFVHADSKSFWSNVENKGIVSKTVPARILTHLACGDFQDIHFYFNEGREARIIFPNILKDSGKINCDVKRKQAHFPLINNYYPDFDFWPNSDTKEVLFLLPDPAMHDIYLYNNIEHVGLLDILADPKTELRWKNQEEFDQYWDKQFWPQVTAFLLELKAEYFVTISDFFKIGLGCDTGFLKKMTSDTRYCNTGHTLYAALTEEEVKTRNAGYFNGVDKSYYSNIGLAETFIDELRTYAYVIEKITNTNDPDRTKILSFMPIMNELVKSLDISQRDLNFNPKDLSPEKKLEMMTVPGIYQVLGEQAIGHFLTNHEALSGSIQKRIQEIEATGLTLEVLNANSEQLRSFPSSNIVKLQIYSNLDKSLHYLMKNLLEDYLGGNNIIYIKK